MITLRFGNVFSAAVALGLGGLFASGLNFPASAQTAVEKAGEIKAWRENCSDPDPDLRLAYIEQALNGKDITIKRICVRQALESDNTDIQNLGLRAAIAMRPKLLFTVQKPEMLNPEYKSTLKTNNEKSHYQHIEKVYAALEGGVPFNIDGKNVGDSIKKMFAMINVNKETDQYSGDAEISGLSFTWNGAININASYPQDRGCRISTRLAPGAVLKGTIKCGNADAMQVSADLL